MSELLPCPFCGVWNNLSVKHDDGLSWVKCHGCGATGPETTKYSGDDGEPVTDWNTRAQQAKPVVDDAMVDRALIAWIGPLWSLLKDHTVKRLKRDMAMTLTAALSTGE
ncbi:MAG: Lar family restriction alleviation protein [Alphaproteobacteria bacterium]|nr:Lar family restriction alleviation protein [Alphaproteobacteria bacterium]